jgi:hypothetical protein
MNNDANEMGIAVKFVIIFMKIVTLMNKFLFLQSNH